MKDDLKRMEDKINLLKGDFYSSLERNFEDIKNNIVRSNKEGYDELKLNVEKGIKGEIDNLKSFFSELINKNEGQVQGQIPIQQLAVNVNTDLHAQNENPNSS